MENKGTLVFNISMTKTEAYHKAIVSDNTTASLGSLWDGIVIDRTVKTYELDPDCVHHFIIPTSGKDIVTGECKKCEGRREFRNTFDSILRHHDPMIDRELSISALQNIKETELEKDYVKPLTDLLSFTAPDIDSSPSPA